MKSSLTWEVTFTRDVLGVGREGLAFLNLEREKKSLSRFLTEGLLSGTPSRGVPPCAMQRASSPNLDHDQISGRSSPAQRHMATIAISKVTGIAGRENRRLLRGSDRSPPVFQRHARNSTSTRSKRRAFFALSESTALSERRLVNNHWLDIVQPVAGTERDCTQQLQLCESRRHRFLQTESKGRRKTMETAAKHPSQSQHWPSAPSPRPRTRSGSGGKC